MWDLRALWWIVAYTAGPRRRAPFKASCVLFSSDINFPYILIKIINSTYAPNSAQAGSEYRSAILPFYRKLPRRRLRAAIAHRVETRHADAVTAELTPRSQGLW